MLKRIEALANVATIVVCTIAAAWFLRDMAGATPQASSSAATRSQQVYAAGEQLPPLKEVDYSLSETTVLLVVREGCRYCQESIPFYQKLAPAIRQTNGGARLVVVSSDSPDTIQRFLSAHEIVADKIVQAPPGALKVPGTPTVIIATAEGKVESAWAGRLDAAEEARVISAVESRKGN